MTLAQPPSDPTGGSLPAVYDPFWPGPPTPSSFAPAAPVPAEWFGADPAAGWPASAPAKPSSPFSLGNFSLKDLQSWVARMGGIPGLLDKIGKAQKLMQTLSQMAPMMKLLVKTFAGKSGSDDDANPARNRRRKRRKRKTAYGRRLARRERRRGGPASPAVRRRRYRRRRRRRKRSPGGAPPRLRT